MRTEAFNSSKALDLIHLLLDSVPYNYLDMHEFNADSVIGVVSYSTLFAQASTWSAGLNSCHKVPSGHVLAVVTLTDGDYGFIEVEYVDSKILTCDAIKASSKNILLSMLSKEECDSLDLGSALDFVEAA